VPGSWAGADSGPAGSVVAEGVPPGEAWWLLPPPEVVAQ
jgi:hypothetical protein